MTMAMRGPLRGDEEQVSVESVTRGHPDKVCDQISDAVLDAALKGDPNSRVAIEVTGKSEITVFGEMTTMTQVDIPAVARTVFEEIGYGGRFGDVQGVRVDVTKQSGDIALINDPQEQGAGDQGCMVGYAVQNPDHEHMPTAVSLAHRLVRRLEVKRAELDWLGPDGKSLVVMEGDRVVRVTIAAQHAVEMAIGDLREAIYEQVIAPVVGGIPFRSCTINGTGAFVKGGFGADSGLTGRKVAVDCYGPVVEVGGGCFSGKDPTKVDRTAAYLCRMIAKHIVALGLAREAVVKMAFAINGKSPEMFSIKASGAEMSDRLLVQWAMRHFPLSPGGMIKFLGLDKPEGWNYVQTAAYGHFGRPEFPWEAVDASIAP